MSGSIPYISNIEILSGAFVTLKNEIILVHGKHEMVAEKICNNRLPDIDRKLFELWKKSNQKLGISREEDFLIYVALYDKIENVVKRRITTASQTPYERYFNYCLMDWNINRKRPLIYNPETEKFEKLHTGWEYTNYEDLEAQAEAEEIKKNVPYEDRHLFFKK